MIKRVKMESLVNFALQKKYSKVRKLRSRLEEMNGKEELVLGNILHNSIEEIFRNPAVLTLQSRRPEDFEDCSNCHLRNACVVSCANRSYNQTRGFNEKSEMCDYYKIMFSELLFRLDKNFEGMLTLL